MSASFAHRLAALQHSLTPDQAFLLTTPTDITYFTGFDILVPEEREAFLVVTHQTTFLLHASFSPTPEIEGVKRLSGTHVTQLASHLATIRQVVPFSTLVIDKTRLFADELEALQSVKDLKLTTLDRKLIWQLRMVKDVDEVAALRQAGVIASQAFAQLQPEIKVGMTEIDVQQLLDRLMAEAGSQRPAFPTIVAFGAHGALPHHQPTETALTIDTPILIDFGATFAHYRSDCTRSWWFGDHPSAEFTKIKNLVDEAYQRTLTALTDRSQPLTAKRVDEASRTFLTEAGYSQEYIHTTGHGVGLDIHEPPSLYWKNTATLSPKMAVTIEPGLYLNGHFGYRWENTVLLTETSYELLTTHD